MHRVWESLGSRANDQRRAAEDLPEMQPGLRQATGVRWRWLHLEGRRLVRRSLQLFEEGIEERERRQHHDIDELLLERSRDDQHDIIDIINEQRRLELRVERACSQARRR